MTRFILFLISLNILTSPHLVTSEDPGEVTLAQHTKALLAFIDNIQITHKVDANGNSYKWDRSKSACTWKGVECINDVTIAYLRFPSASIIGQIPPNTIGNITTLRVLSIHGNAINGTIPPDFSNLRNLKTFAIDSNNFTGYLPEIDAPELDSFNVSHNKFNGSVPESFSKFPKEAFAGNKKLCGEPLPACDNKTTFPSPPQVGDSRDDEKKPKKKKLSVEKIVAISVGSSLLLLILLTCLRKKKTRGQSQRLQEPMLETPSSKGDLTATSAEGERNELVFFDGGIYGFGLEDLRQASAQILGRGSVGTTYKTAVKDGTTVIVKRLRNVAVTKQEFDLRMKVLGGMKNENVVPLIAYHYSNYEKLLVYDYMHGGSLSALLHGKRGLGQKPLDWDHRLRIALSAAKGVAYLHMVGNIAHGNIKSSNILLRQEPHITDASVSDYGLKILVKESHSAFENIETDENLKFKSDVYSFGVLLLELLTGKAKAPNHPSLGDQGSDLASWVQSVARDKGAANVFDEELKRSQNIEQEMLQLLQIAKGCVSKIQDRPTMQEVARMIGEITRDEIIVGFYPTPSTDAQSSPAVTP